MNEKISQVMLACALLLCVGDIKAEKIGIPTCVMRPNFMTIANQRIYIVEQPAKIHLYRIEPGRLAFVKTFGCEGQGPGEFDFIHRLRPLKDHLEIPTAGKFARFTLDGRFLDEIKLPISVFKNRIFRVGENYLARDLQIDNEGITITIRLYDKDFKLIRELGLQRQSGSIYKINPVTDYYSTCVSGDKIFVIDSRRKTLVIMYDQNGVEQNKIHLALPPIKMTTALKEIILKPFKGSPSRWKEIERRIILPNQTPGLDYFEVVDDKIIARTFHYREQSVEFVVFDFLGREFETTIFAPN